MVLRFRSGDCVADKKQGRNCSDCPVSQDMVHRNFAKIHTKHSKNWGFGQFSLAVAFRIFTLTGPSDKVLTVARNYS